MYNEIVEYQDSFEVLLLISQKFEPSGRVPELGSIPNTRRHKPRSAVFKLYFSNSKNMIVTGGETSHDGLWGAERPHSRTRRDSSFAAVTLFDISKTFVFS